MKGTAKLVMGATLIMVVSLVIVLALVLVLLAELYCSLLLRKRQQRFRSTTITTTTTAATSPQPSQYSSSSAPLSSVYAQGVLLAPPRNFLFPSININKQQGQGKDTENHKQKQHYPNSNQVIEILTQQYPNKPPNPIGFISASSPSPPPSISLAASPQQPIQEVAFEVTNTTIGVGGGGGGGDEHFVYISNPIYDNESCRHGGGGGGIGTPFETPDSSPSHFEMEAGWSSEDEEQSASSSLPMTPPLTPMKKLLPMEACSSVSVSLRDVGTSGSGSDSNNGLSSSSSAGSPSTSPSW